MKVKSIQPDTIGTDNPVIRDIKDDPEQTFIPGMKPKPPPLQLSLITEECTQ